MFEKQSVSSGGNHATGAKLGKACNRCKAQEITQPVPSAGKDVTNTKRGKLPCNRCQAGEIGRKARHYCD